MSNYDGSLLTPLCFTILGNSSCSNISLKVNTKLFNRGNRAIAWTIKLRWYEERPSLILGYSLARGRINGRPISVLAGSICLFHPMQMGQAVKFYSAEDRRNVANSQALTYLIENLFINHFTHTGNKNAERILVYRDGASSESEVEEVEVLKDIRDKFFKGQETCPSLTIVMSNKDHNINIMPSTQSPQNKKNKNVDKNVPSGTVVSAAEEFQLDVKGTEGKFSFVLTAQGGLKGTSKPMLYSCVLNEEGSNLDRTSLTSLTYELGFQCKSLLIWLAVLYQATIISSLFY